MNVEKYDVVLHLPLSHSPQTFVVDVNVVERLCANYDIKVERELICSGDAVFYNTLFNTLKDHSDSPGKIIFRVNLPSSSWLPYNEALKYY